MSDLNSDDTNYKNVSSLLMVFSAPITPFPPPVNAWIDEFGDEWVDEFSQVWTIY